MARYRHAVPATLAVGLIGAAIATVLLNVRADEVIAHPRLGAVVPTADGGVDVEYRPGVHAIQWPSAPGRPTIVMVPGDGANRTDSLLSAVARDLHQFGYGALIIDKSYVARRGTDSGGDEEAADVGAAVTWSRAHTSGPVALYGVSAGGYEALLAVARGTIVEAIVTDGGFASAPLTYVPGEAPANHRLRFLYKLMAPLYPLVSGGGHLRDIRRVLGRREWNVPTLIIQGTADRDVGPDNGPDLQALTKGQLWMKEGAHHLGAYWADPRGYIARVATFLDRIGGGDSRRIVNG